MIARSHAGSAAAASATASSGSAAARPLPEPYVQLAHIEVDPAQLEAYRIALREQITAAIRDEQGVLALHAVSDKDNPARITVFEIYRDAAAYRAHLVSTHFKTYKAATEKMVTSLTLVQCDPIVLGAKGR
jgi:quinol monooxygenase YgiN